MGARALKPKISNLKKMAFLFHHHRKKYYFPGFHFLLLQEQYLDTCSCNFKGLWPKLLIHLMIYISKEYISNNFICTQEFKSDKKSKSYSTIVKKIKIKPSSFKLR